MSVKQVLSIAIGDQLFGIDIIAVQDVLRRSEATYVPLTGDKISGLMNLRGHIVTLINVAHCLGLEREQTEYAQQSGMNIVVEHHKELFGLLFDRVDDIQEIDLQFMEPMPRTLDQAWHIIGDGVCRLPEGLMIILNPYALIESATVDAVSSNLKEHSE